jgi:hypothetical protein
MLKNNIFVDITIPVLHYKTSFYVTTFQLICWENVTLLALCVCFIPVFYSEYEQQCWVIGGIIGNISESRYPKDGRNKAHIQSQ